MKVILLAAGYGTRLQRDISQDASGKYSHLAGLPKPLVPIATKPLISRWMECLVQHEAIDKVYLVTNELYREQFESWRQDWPQVSLVSDGTTSNEDRIGAVGCIQLAVRDGNIADDILVIGGDTLFFEDFSLPAFLSEFEKRKEASPAASLVVSNQIPDEETIKRGILEVNEDMRVTAFLEKPKPQETSSRRACPCFYLFSQRSLPHLDNFLQEDRPMKEKDATGNFVKYLHSRLPVYVYDISGRFDVGSLADYEVCNQYFMNKEKNETA
ncbi:UTP--glucose-1-phosphate uridylyltransferase-like [Diadema antillarum]|uniref:UTP--glucose-1-phosphate uridylyltransferase-like n=1 Tax=Diadema antillarum TaxID=105358 RepID=UPI003A89CDAF